MGIVASPTTYIKIREENTRELSGYINWSTRGASGANLSYIKLTVQIQDKAGHLSAPVSFPLSFGRDYEQEDPPSGIFQNRNLGSIVIRIRLDPLFGYPEISH